MEELIDSLDWNVLKLSMVKVKYLGNLNRTAKLLASNDLLPILYHFKKECFDDRQFRNDLARAFPLQNAPWKTESELLATCAIYYDEVCEQQQ